MACCLVKRLRNFLKGSLGIHKLERGVIADPTDRATICLPQRLIAEKQTIWSAVMETMMKIGPDPTAPSTMLLYYPPDAENYTVETE